MDSPGLWLGVAIGVGLVFLTLVAVFATMRLRPQFAGIPAEEREGLAMPALQKRAWWGLFVGFAALAVLAVLFMIAGPDAFLGEARFRFLVYAVFLIGIGTIPLLILPLVAPGRKARDEAAPMDERDRRILATGPTVQSGAAVLALALWTIGLSEAYDADGAVPLVYLQLVFGSVVLVNAIAFAAGILLGYWRTDGHGEG